jgi:hypothetical protein
MIFQTIVDETIEIKYSFSQTPNHQMTITTKLGIKNLLQSLQR